MLISHSILCKPCFNIHHYQQHHDHYYTMQKIAFLYYSIHALLAFTLCFQKVNSICNIAQTIKLCLLLKCIT
ncbi:hypothetical protein K492DRAFT_205839, partial [Lichtheimia hyalospora FSU 10163]